MIITKKKIEESMVIFTVIAVIISDIIIKLVSVRFLNLGVETYLTALLSFISIFIFFRTKYKYGVKLIPINLLIIFGSWLCYMIFSLIRGGLLANGYWDFKFLLLSSTSFTLIASVFFIGQNLYFSKLIINFFLKKFYPISFLIIPLAFVSSTQLYARLVIPIGIYLLFMPYFEKKWRILIIIIALLSISVDITFRTNIIKIGISLLILFLYFFKNLINTFLTKFLWFIFFTVPIMFLTAGLFYDYNIFKEISKNNEVTTINSHGEEQSLSADTRTGLFTEVIEDVVKKNSIIFGKSPSQGYQSLLFYDSGGGINGTRYITEVNMLNIFLYYGVVGLFLFFLLLASISYLAISRSNNKISKMLGLLLASRFLLSFLEEFTRYDLNFYFFWLIMGLVSSTRFRAMTDREIKMWLYYSNESLVYKFNKNKIYKIK